tara:strand:+ start:9432 stop:10124 length:693 start_codon:yes stop_codon:yes gene_type:complete
MKIHIFYSHYNVEGTDNKFRPSWFDYEKCFINLLDTIEGKDIDLHLIMDGKIENNWIHKYKHRYISHEVTAGNMRDAGWQMFKIALDLVTIKDDDLIYFLENDYLHIKGWDKHIINLFSCLEGLNYVTLYDHYDKYFAQDYDNLASKIFVSDTHHWRTTPSTCGSFIVSKKLWKEDYVFHVSLEGDHNKWLAINEQKGRFILSAVPGLSTHVMSNLMSPIIDWEQINKKI